MEKLIKPFRGVPEGEIYPVQFAAGDDCPPELVAGALSVGALRLAAQLPPLGALESQAHEVPDLSASEVQLAATSASGDAEPQEREASTSDSAPATDKESLIGQLEAAGIPFDKRWGAGKLSAALAEGKKE
ncbi:hypothetical protein [uncultured Stenotrophomonas sp.]|uniref:hypothetical protein n=1 Tax=uncultured Stenotrophomonas sp. TaxID=165438 RepID=UPI0025DD3612|nr:hypothetical protein [uncultured Stenotrophomonas sp.]